jgi:hypothetical protein
MRWLCVFSGEFVGQLMIGGVVSGEFAGHVCLLKSHSLSGSRERVALVEEKKKAKLRAMTLGCEWASGSSYFVVGVVSVPQRLRD